MSPILRALKAASVIRICFALLLGFLSAFPVLASFTPAAGTNTFTAVASTHLYYHSDLGGNITALVNTNDVVVGRYQYDPYGNVSMMSGEAAESNTYRFSSKAYDSNFDLYYYGYRFYVPALQRWLNKDPIGEDGGYNLYGFVNNNPNRFVDPNGKNAYLINYDDFAGHTFFAVDNPAGGGIIFEFFSQDWHNNPGALSGLQAIFADDGYVQITEVESLESWMGDLLGDGGQININGIALGTPTDDALIIDSIKDYAKDPGFYYLLLGKQCHSRAQDWFNEYKQGGEWDWMSKCIVLTPPNPQLRFPDRFWKTPSFLNQPFTLK